MKNTIKPKAVYQVLENGNTIRRPPRIVPAGVFVEVIDIGENGYAHCKVLHIIKQAKGQKLRCGQKVFFSLVNLGIPDLFPGLYSKPTKWLNAVKNPEPLANAIEKIIEKRQRKSKAVTALVINTADSIKKLLKEGQIFKSDKAPTLLVQAVTAQGNVEYKMLDKVHLESVDDFITYLVDNAYYTTPVMNWRRSAKIIWVAMSPFLGMMGAIFITKLLEKRALK